MKSKKIITALVMALCLSSVSSVFAEKNAYRANMYECKPMWVNSTAVYTYVEGDRSGLDAYAVITAKKDKNVKGTLYLQKYKSGSWSTVKSWEFSDSGYTEVRKSYTVGSGKYRTKVSVKVGGESITEYSDEKDVK